VPLTVPNLNGRGAGSHELGTVTVSAR